MRIQLNGQPHEVEDNLTLPQLIASLNLKSEQIAIEVNQKVIRRGQWPGTVLRDDDKIEIVHFVGGGCNANVSLRLSGRRFSLSHGEIELKLHCKQEQ